MASNETKFGIVDSGSNIPDSSGALGNTANSTQNTSTTPTANIQPVTNIETPTTQAVPVNTAVDTNQLESQANVAVNLPTTTEPERIQVDAPDASISEEGSQKKIAELNEQVNVLKSQKDSVQSRDDVKAGFDAIGNIGKFESGLGDDIQLQKKKEAKTEIDNKILKKSRDFDLALRDAQDTFGTRAQKSAIKGDITKNFNRQLADLSIIQMARAGEYNDARSFVDEKVRLELQDRRANLDGLLFMYGENKERFTKLEQRQFEKKIQTEERAYAEEYDTRKQLEDMKLTMTINATEAGAGNGTLQSIQNAKDTTSLLSLPNASIYTKSKADRLSEQLIQINVAKASQALNTATTNLVATGISPVTGKPYNTSQGDSGGFALRMEDSEGSLLGGKGKFIPGVPDFAKSSDRRLFEQAEQNFITAQLRKESGAAISDDEFAKARDVYIPLATDSQKTLDAKTRARTVVTQNMKNLSVGSYDELKRDVAATSGGDISSYIDVVENSITDPYANVLFSLRSSTSPVNN